MDNLEKLLRAKCQSDGLPAVLAAVGGACLFCSGYYSVAGGSNNPTISFVYDQTANSLFSLQELTELALRSPSGR